MGLGFGDRDSGRHLLERAAVRFVLPSDTFQGLKATEAFKRVNAAHRRTHEAEREKDNKD